MKRWLVLICSSALIFLGSSASAQFGVKLEVYGSITDAITYRVSALPSLSSSGSFALIFDARLDAAREFNTRSPLYLALIGSPLVTAVYGDSGGGWPNFAFAGVEFVARIGAKTAYYYVALDAALALGALLENSRLQFAVRNRTGIVAGNSFLEAELYFGVVFDVLFLRASVLYKVNSWLRIGLAYSLSSGVGGGGG